MMDRLAIWCDRAVWLIVLGLTAFGVLFLLGGRVRGSDPEAAVRVATAVSAGVVNPVPAAVLRGPAPRPMPADPYAALLDRLPAGEANAVLVASGVPAPAGAEAVTIPRHVGLYRCWRDATGSPVMVPAGLPGPAAKLFFSAAPALVPAAPVCRT